MDAPATPPVPHVVDGFHFRRRPRNSSTASAVVPTLVKPVSPPAPPPPPPPLPLLASQIGTPAPAPPARAALLATLPTPGEQTARPVEVPRSAVVNKVVSATPKPSKLYASVPADLPEETRLRMLVEAALREQYTRAADAAGSDPVAAGDLRALERVVLDVIDVAQEHEQATASAKASAALAAKTAGRDPLPHQPLDNPVNAVLREREAALSFAVEQFTAELKQWERIEENLPAIAAERDVKVIVPPVPPLVDLIGVPDPTSLSAPAVRAFENFLLNTDDIVHKLKLLERSHADAENTAVAVADTLNAHAFDGVFDINCAAVVPAPSPPPKSSETNQ